MGYIDDHHDDEINEDYLKSQSKKLKIKAAIGNTTAIKAHTKNYPKNNKIKMDIIWASLECEVHPTSLKKHWASKEI